MIDLRTLLPDVVAIATEAGRAIMEIYDGEFAVELKDDRTPLTAADRAAHAVILAGLGRLAASLPVLSEESAASEHAGRHRWQRFWLVDPLDGTREFIKRNGEFTVNIALIEGHRPVAGVVGAPAIGRTYYGAVGHGAFRQGSDGTRPIAVRREVLIGVALPVLDAHELELPVALWRVQQHLGTSRVDRVRGGEPRIERVEAHRPRRGRDAGLSGDGVPVSLRLVEGVVPGDRRPHRLYVGGDGPVSRECRHDGGEPCQREGAEREPGNERSLHRISLPGRSP